MISYPLPRVTRKLFDHAVAKFRSDRDETGMIAVSMIAFAAVRQGVISSQEYADSPAARHRLARSSHQKQRARRRQARRLQPMTEPLTIADFAMLAARISQVAAAWSADALSGGIDHDSPMSPQAVTRFAAEINTRVASVVYRAGIRT
jgi:hypothetical protein